jgi:ribokinase
MNDEVIVVGDLMVDVVVRPERALQHGSDTTSTIEIGGGGSAANTACWLASTGRTVRLVAAVGDDALGQTAITALERSGVAFGGHVVERHATGTCVVLVDESGERTMLPDRGANDRLDPAAVAVALATGPVWVHVSGYALLGERSREAALVALRQDARGAVPCSVDAASAAPLRTAGAHRFLEWIAGCSVLFANDDELAALGGESVALGFAGEVVAKHGPAGASWTDGHDAASVPAVGVEVVSTVGAGDAFDAGFLSARLRGARPTDALESGARLAAKALVQAGARPTWATPASERG